MNVKKPTILGMTLCFVFFFVSTISAVGSPNKSVTITSTQYSVSTENVYGHHKYFAAKNEDSSTNKLYADAYRSDGSGWLEDTSILMGIGSGFEFAKTKIYSQNYFWRLTLDPQGLNAGCNGWGAIWFA